MNWDAFDAKYQHTWPYRLAMWAAQWLCMVLIGIVVGAVAYFVFDTTGHRGLMRHLGRIVSLLVVSYILCYPIYRIIRRLVTRFGAASKPNENARDVWRVCTVAAVLFASAYAHDATMRRFHIARADTEIIASAISKYVAHCGGLPAHDPGTDCPVGEPGGPYVVPFANLYHLRQTNPNGQIDGPFLTSWPPPWFGAGVNDSYDSYAYYILAGGTFVICARGERTGASSEGRRSCPS